MIPGLVKTNFKNYSYLFLDLQVAAARSIGTVGSIKLVIIAGEDGVEQDAHDGSNGQAGQVDGDTTHSEGQTAHRVEAQRADQDDSGNDQVAAVGKVHTVLDHIADTDRGDHSVQHKADAANDAGGDGVDDGLKLGAEAQDHSHHSGNADDERIVDAAQGQNTGVLTVGSIGGAAQQTCHGSGKAVAHQGAVQAGIIDIVVADRSADGSDIAHMLHHGCQRNGDDGEHCADELRAAVDGKQTHGTLVQGDAEPVGSSNGLKVDCTSDQSHSIGDQHTDQDGQDLDHALAPDVADNNSAQGHKSQQPVGLAVGDGRGGQDQTNRDDDGACDHRREEFHNAADAKGGDEQADQQVQNAGQCHARAGVGQHFGIDNGQVAVCVSQHGGYNGKTAQVSKRGAKEGRDLALGDKVEQQGAQTGTEQSGGNAQAGEQGHQHSCAEHGKHVLQAQDQHPSGAELPGIVNALGVIDLFTHREVLLSSLPKKRGIAAATAVPQSFWSRFKKRDRKAKHALRKVERNILLSPSLSDFIKYTRNPAQMQSVCRSFPQLFGRTS